MDEAAANGHLDVVRWLHEHRTEGCTRAAMNGAALAGDLAMLEFLRSSRSEGCTAQAFVNAYNGNHLEVMVWLEANYADPFDPRDRAYRRELA